MSVGENIQSKDQSLLNIKSTNDVPSSSSNVENSTSLNNSLTEIKDDITMSDERTKRSENEKTYINEEQSVKPCSEITSNEDIKPKIEPKIE